MRRKSDKEIGKEFRIFLILGIVIILIGSSSLLLPFMPTTPYEEYTEKEVVISKFDYHYGGYRGTSYCYIITEDGEKYNVTGEYVRSELYEVLTEGTVAVIKYRTNNIFRFKKYVEEITVNGTKLVTFNNSDPINWPLLIVFSFTCFLIGVIFLFAYREQIIRNRKLQAKRDAKIIKKYGKLKK